jgi:hypothetical protein
MNDPPSSSTDTPFTPPKKKPSIFWWIGGAFVVLLMLFVFQLFGPSPRLEVSPQTTRITSPLRPDGLPDYEQYVLDQMRAGVTPENNAAALLWPALWPGELDRPHYVLIAKELGLDGVPSAADAVVPVHKQIQHWLASQTPTSADPDQNNSDAAIQELAIEDQVMSRPWTSDQFPWLAEWVKENQKPLDMMVAASRRPRCYIPSPTMLNRQNDPLVAIMLPGVQGVRESGRSLGARAMWHVGEKRPTEAWQDLYAIHRIGRLTAQGQTLVEQLVGIAIDGIAAGGTVTLLDESQLTPQQARQVLSDLQALEYFSGMARCMDGLERLSFLDIVTRFSRGEMSRDVLVWVGDGDLLSLLRHLRINWNVVLREGNKWYDRYVEAAELPTYEARRQAFDQIEGDLQRLAGRLRPGTVVASVLNPSARNDAVASVLIGKFLPAVNAAMAAQDRANAKLDLLRLAAALAVFRAAKGSYPDSLEELAPSVLAELPVDLFHAKPYFYRRIGDGYLLYTMGANGQDDGGSNEQMGIYEGDDPNDFSETEAETMREKIRSGADDFAIRVPRPPAKEPDMLDQGVPSEP